MLHVISTCPHRCAVWCSCSYAFWSVSPSSILVYRGTEKQDTAEQFQNREIQWKCVFRKIKPLDAREGFGGSGKCNVIFRRTFEMQNEPMRTIQKKKDVLKHLSTTATSTPSSTTKEWRHTTRTYDDRNGNTAAINKRQTKKKTTIGGISLSS